jgi:hypothetical protein
MSDAFKSLKDVIESDIARFKREFNNPPPKRYVYGDGSGVQAIIDVPDGEQPYYGKSEVERILPLQIALNDLILRRH